MMKKKILLIAMAVVMVVGASGCTTTKTVSYTDADGNTTTTTETSDNNGTTIVVESADSDGTVVSQEEVSEVFEEAVDEVVDEQGDDGIEYQVVESEDGYKVTFNPEYFVYDDSGEYEGKDSVYIRCTIDEENQYENYIDVGIVEGYTAEELINGIAYQNDTEEEASPMHIVFANGEYDAYYFEKHLTDTFLVTFYAIDGESAPYLIEVGSHIYSDDDEYAYYVAGAMEEAFLSLEFES